jgi:hypothetical protein
MTEFMTLHNKSEIEAIAEAIRKTEAAGEGPITMTLGDRCPPEYERRLVTLSVNGKVAVVVPFTGEIEDLWAIVEKMQGPKQVIIERWYSST